MNPERAWRFNGVVNKVFTDAHVKNANDVDMAVSALSVNNSLDDENFVDSFVQDFEQAGKALGHPLDENDVTNVENAVKDYAETHRGFGSDKVTGLGVVTFNGDYLNTIRGDYETDGNSTVYTGKTVDEKYHRALGDYNDDYKAQVAQKDENNTLKNRQDFNNLLKTVFEPRNYVYNEVTIDFAQDELADKATTKGGVAVYDAVDTFRDAVERLDVEDAAKDFGGVDTVYARANAFARDHADDLKDVSFEDLVRENSDALKQAGQKDVFTTDTLDKNFDTIRQHSNEVEYGDGEDDYEGYDVTEPVDDGEKCVDSTASQSNEVKFNNTVNALVEPRNKEYDEGIMALGFQSAYNKVNVSDEHFASKIGDNFIQASQCLELVDEVNQAGGQDVVFAQAQAFHDAHANEDKEYSLVDIADENAKQLKASKDASVDDKDIVDSETFDTKMRTVWADSNKQFYGDENNYQAPAVKPSKTMAGQNIELVVNSFRPVHYKNKAGEQKLGVLVDASKRGDVAHQPSKFDGAHVVNTYTKYGKQSHVQLVTPESAKKIMAVNGYADTDDKNDPKFIDDSAFEYAADKKYDYGKELAKRGKTMTFTANVFSPEGAKYGDYKFNPNPDKIAESNVSFDEAKHKQAVSERTHEHELNKAKANERKASKSKDEGVEP